VLDRQSRLRIGLLKSIQKHPEGRAERKRTVTLRRAGLSGGLTRRVQVNIRPLLAS